jgi:hypothetical protein
MLAAMMRVLMMVVALPRQKIDFGTSCTKILLFGGIDPSHLLWLGGKR